MIEIANILNKNLKTCLDNDVFRQISTSDSEYPFISKSSKQSIELYLNQKDLKASRELWKNLLIDAICVLKVNDLRENMYNDSEETENLFNINFEKIRKTNTYGIDEILEYFDDFIEFESVLYGTDKYYRDHVIHVLQVWAIGISLITHNNLKFNDGFKINCDFNFHYQLDIKTKSIGISKSELWSIWTIIALCHDLGYPIEKTSKINKQAKKIISHFGNMNFSELNYNFDIFNSFLVDKFLNIVSSKVVFETKETIVQSKFRDKISKSLEEYKHGVFSSLLIFKNFTYFLETDYSITINSLSDEDLRQFQIRKEILRAIAGHTCPKIYHLNLNSISFLLILCDELQEWSRPNFDDFKNNFEHVEPEVVLKEFSMLNEQKIHIQFNYNEDFTETYKKYLIYQKFKNIHNLLRTAKDDIIRKTQKIIFIWDIIFRDKKFTLIFDSNKNAYELINIYEFNKTKKNAWDKGNIIEIYDSN